MSTTNRVFVLSTTLSPLMPCSSARARILLKRKRAAVYKLYPFTIILKDRDTGDTQDVSLGIDPGSSFTGMALVAWFKRGPTCIFGLHVKHRGDVVKTLVRRRALSRSRRRVNNLRYREPRFSNRKRSSGFIAPSIKTRVMNTLTWVSRLYSVVNVRHINFEVVNFNTNELTRKSNTIDIRSTKFRTQMRHYLLTTYNGICQYCHSNNSRMEWDHIHPISKGGSNSIDNSTLACRKCNSDKGNKTLAEWMAELERDNSRESKLRVECIKVVMSKVRGIVRHASIVNYTRNLILADLKSRGYVVKEYPAWETAYNRFQLKLPKDHWIDAAIVGNLTTVDPDMRIVTAMAMQNNQRQMVTMNAHGFPRSNAKVKSIVHGFRTGDISKLNQPAGKYKGSYVGPIVVRLRGEFDIRHLNNRISSKYSNFTILQRFDGYRYISGNGIPKCILI